MKQGTISGGPANSRRRAGARTRRQRRAAAGPPAVAGVRRRIPLYDLMNEEGLDLIDRTTNAKWKETLRTCEPPPLDASVDETLKEFIIRKKASMPDIWH